ncbi:hypothetical protein [Marininema halotolerans]|uniref:Uncharacterized protein n=1 Tax=Marininema halotolerans TaxID=1155944 RepID=A0A1I6NRD0_9BACL|nr:hypothetical protein [Marininema halotolerans]SFS30498.1 hypothetical protein SAMN05444972_10156 [Marininema halotolerans]
MQDAGSQRMNHALQITEEAVQFVRVAQNSADPQVIQQAQRKLEQAKSALEAFGEVGDSNTARDPVSQGLAQLEQSRTTLAQSVSISDPVGYHLY